MNKASKIVLKYCLMIGLVVGMFFVFMNFGIVVAENYLNNTVDGTAIVLITQNDENQIINLTLNNTGLLKVTAPDNITEFNVTIPSSFKYIVSSQASNVSSVFTNTTTVLSWYNFTHGLLNASATSAKSAIAEFGFNVTVGIPGTYVLNITSLNGTAGNLTYSNSSISVTVTGSWILSGMTLDINGTPLNNSQINVTIRDTSFNIVGYNSTNSSANGWFNLTVPGNPTWFYQPVIRHFINNGSDTLDIDGIGQTMPAFPYAEMSAGLNISSYLRDAGIINISLINGTHRGFQNVTKGNYGPRKFSYQIKDQQTGFSIKESWTNVLGVEVQVPRDRNYSIMIYPNDSMPLSYNWNNFTGANITYNLTGDAGNVSFYNITNHKLTKEFNSSETLYLINGTIFNGTDSDPGWNEFNITAYLLEAGNVIYVGSNAMNFFNNTNHFNVTNGTYNMSLAAPAEGANYLLFASARNGTNYYGGYRNISVTYGGAPSTAINFTMYPMMDSVNWGNTSRNITLRDTSGYSSVGMNATKQAFNIINSTNGTFNNIEATMELTVNYSNYNATSFTFMSNLGQGTASSFYFPLINATGIEEINIYSMNGAPKRIGKRTPQQILSGAGNNFTLSAFNPGAIDGSVGSGLINVAIYKSNSTCDVPSPHSSCILTSSSSMSSFNPLAAIMGGGKVSFRMGKNNSGINIHYVSVDMIASGPPDALFDSSETTSTANGFESVLRFGSSGPTIYDYVLVSMPYTEGSVNVTGLNENADINMSIPAFYDEDWNVVWNASLNGSVGASLAGNYSHYATYASQWQTLMGGVNCTNVVGSFDATTPCYINKTSNRIWIRLPHFSGNQPYLNASAVIASSASDSSDTTAGAGTVPYWTLTRSITEEEFKAGFTKDLGVKQRITFDVGGASHSMGVVSITASTVTIEVSSTTQKATLSIGDTRRFDITEDGYYDLSVKLNSISGSKADLTTKSIRELVTEESEAEEQEKENKATTDLLDSSSDLNWLWILVGVVVVLVFAGIVYWLKKTKRI